jgi:hypothetical protein
MSGQLHAPAGLTQEKHLRYPLDTRLRGQQNQSARCGEEKNLFPSPGIEPRPSSPLL